MSNLDSPQMLVFDDSYNTAQRNFWSVVRALGLTITFLFMLSVLRILTRKLSSPWICPRSLFSKILNGLLFGWTLCILPAKFEVRSFTHFRDNSDLSFEGCDPPILGKRRPYGVGDGTVRKSIDEFL